MIQPIRLRNGWNAIISDEWICKNEDLSLVRWICQCFGVPHHSGVEHYFSGCSLGKAEHTAFDSVSIFEHKDSFSIHAISSHTAVGVGGIFSIFRVKGIDLKEHGPTIQRC